MHVPQWLLVISSSSKKLVKPFIDIFQTNNYLQVKSGAKEIIILIIIIIIIITILTIIKIIIIVINNDNNNDNDSDNNNN